MTRTGLMFCTVVPLLLAACVSVAAAAETPGTDKDTTTSRLVTALTETHAPFDSEPIRTDRPEESRAAYPAEVKRTAPKERPGPSASLDVSLGQLAPNHGPGLKNGSGLYSFGIGLGIVPKRLVSFRLEYLYTERDYDTTRTVSALFVRTDNRMTLTTSTLLLGTLISWPVDRSFRCYATGGIGYFSSTLSLEGMSVLTGQTGSLLEDKDTSIGYHAGAGIEIDVGMRGVISLDYRRWFVHGSFPSFGLDNADIGGVNHTIRYGEYF